MHTQTQTHHVDPWICQIGEPGRRNCSGAETTRARRQATRRLLLSFQRNHRVAPPRLKPPPRSDLGPQGQTQPCPRAPHSARARLPAEQTRQHWRGTMAQTPRSPKHQFAAAQNTSRPGAGQGPAPGANNPAHLRAAFADAHRKYQLRAKLHQHRNAAPGLTMSPGCSHALNCIKRHLKRSLRHRLLAKAGSTALPHALRARGCNPNAAASSAPTCSARALTQHASRG